MQPFRLHVFVCEQKKPDGLPCCSARGGSQLLEALRREVSVGGLAGEVLVTSCGSLGLCEHGPNMVVYPEGVWYSGVTEADAAEIVSEHFKAGRPVARLVRADEAEIRAEIQLNRGRAMEARRAQEASGMLPDELNESIRAFQESRAILSALELDVFSAVGEGARAAEVALKLGANPRATEMLLNALAAMKLLHKADGRFRNTPQTSRYFTAGSPDNARLALLHMVHLWPRWSALTASVIAGTATAADTGDADWTEAFIAAMHRNASARAPLVVKAVGAEQVRRMLDVGGGSGAYSIAFAQANPALEAEILDTAAVAPIAARHIQAAAVSGRVSVRAGDLHAPDLGTGFDLVFVSAICHMLDEQENAALLASSYAALAPGGRIVIQDFILEPDKASPRFAALFALNMLVGTQGGSNYSAQEYASWLKQAGFGEIRHQRLPGPTGLMIGTR